MSVLIEKKEVIDFVADKEVLDTYLNKIKAIVEKVIYAWKGKSDFDFTFLNSVENQITNEGKISERQMDAINNIYLKLRVNKK
jgi:hypothetical protein